MFCTSQPCCQLKPDKEGALSGFHVPARHVLLPFPHSHLHLRQRPVSSGRGSRFSISRCRSTACTSSERHCAGERCSVGRAACRRAAALPRPGPLLPPPAPRARAGAHSGGPGSLLMAGCMWTGAAVCLVSRKAAGRRGQEVLWGPSLPGGLPEGLLVLAIPQQAAVCEMGACNKRWPCLAGLRCAWRLHVASSRLPSSLPPSSLASPAASPIAF